MALAEEVDAGAVVKRADKAGLRLVRFLWCGNDGTVRAKASSLHGLEGRIRSGIGLTVAMQAMNGLDHLQPVRDMGPVGEIRLVPDPDTFRVLPYAPNTGAMLVDQRTLDGEIAPVDQRGFLRRMADRLAERGVLAAGGERELVLEGDLERGAALGEALGHAAQEGALVDGRRIAGQRPLVDEHRAGARRVRQHAERGGVGHEADLTDRPHVGHGLQVVEPVHRVHRHRQADAAAHAALEAVTRRGLRANRAVVAAPQEADEPEGLVVRALGDLRRLHGLILVRAATGVQP